MVTRADHHFFEARDLFLLLSFVVDEDEIQARDGWTGDVMCDGLTISLPPRHPHDDNVGQE